MLACISNKQGFEFSLTANLDLASKQTSNFHKLKNKNNKPEEIKEEIRRGRVQIK